MVIITRIMNKRITLTALILMFVVFNISSQSKKQPVLIEEFSNTGCGPCASYSEVLDTTVSYLLGDVVSVKYHGYYPDRNDVFYKNLKSDMDKKIVLYNVTAYPTTVVNGKVVGNSLSGSYLKYAIEKNAFKDHKFDIDVTADVANHNLHVKAVVTPASNVSNSNLRLHVIVIEEFYENAAVFKNGETHVRNITRQMLPDGDGYDLGSTLSQGSQYNYETDWAITNFGDEKQLGVVAFLQDMQTKEVLATAYVPRKTDAQDDLRLMNIENTPDKICTPNYYGTVTFRNEGANKVTSAKLNVSINGKTKVYGWTGELSRLDRQEMQFADFTDFDFNTLSDANSVELWLSDINGTSKESNRLTTSFSSAIKAENSVTLRFYTDNKPEESTWKVFDSAGEVVREGGPYDEKRKIYTENLNLTTDDCYAIEFYDAGGDGIKGSNGNGYYQLYQITSDKKRKLLAQGDYSGKGHTVDFGLTNADPSAGINETRTGETAPSTPVTLYDTDGKTIGRTTAGEIEKSGFDTVGKGVTIVKYNDKSSKTRKLIR